MEFGHLEGHEKARLEGQQPYLGDLLLGMVMNHLLTGMILRVHPGKLT